MTKPTRPLQLALVGNPNTGKTTLFNAFTGLRQRIGNYPGITVSMATGTVFLGKEAAYITDLPGTYSLAASSPDEKIVHDYLNGNIVNTPRPDVVVCVVDATNLSKNLYLASQLAEHQLPMVIALTFWDSAIRLKTQLELDTLEQRLGIRIIPVNVTKNQGVQELKDAILTAHRQHQCMHRLHWEPEIAHTLDHFRTELQAAGITVNAPESQRLIFDSTQPTLPGVADPSATAIRDAIQHARAGIRKAGFHPHTVEAVLHHRHLTASLDGVITQRIHSQLRRGESIDRLLTHKVWGMLIFLSFMYLVFQSVYSWSAPFMDLIDFTKGSLQSLVGTWLAHHPQMQSLVSDGMIEGVGAFLIFLPQILILFFFISLLEETGYMARAAFLMDRLFSWAGLSGKSFVPLLSSFACAVPGILSTRTIEDRKSRLITIFIAPLMSCSARLPVYVLLIGALIEPTYGPIVAGITLFALHFLGIAIALPTAYILHKVLKRTPSKPFIIELPEYQIPKLGNVLWRMWAEGREFVYRAGTIIFTITILIWTLLYYPRPEAVELAAIEEVRQEQLASGMSDADFAAALEDEASAIAEALERHIDAAYLNQSFLSRFGRSIQPVFDLAGFDWRISVGILASFPAREVIVSTLGVMFSLGGEVDEESPSLRNSLRQATWTSGPRMGQPLITIPVAFAIMVFFALCQQCGSTLAVIRSEANAKWAIASFVFMTAIAWIGSVLTYQGLSLLLCTDEPHKGSGIEWPSANRP
jgi:ferrous iron transport protein B